MQDDIVALFAYDRWANRKVLDACRKLTAEQYVAEPVAGWSSVRSTISHIALATEFNLRTLAADPDDRIPTEADLATVESTIATNLLGPMRLNAALLQHLLKQRDGAVLTITSGLAFLPMAITPTYCATKAAIHSYSQSLRYQLRSTKLQVVEIIPPYVRTGLMGAGQAADERAMPLDDFINETMAIIKSQDGVAETIVERVKPLRFAEQNGPEKYSAFFKQFNEAMMAPH